MVWSSVTDKMVKLKPKQYLLADDTGGDNNSMMMMMMVTQF